MHFFVALIWLRIKTVSVDAPSTDFFYDLIVAELGGIVFKRVLCLHT
jgi:hypothetical protein